MEEIILEAESRKELGRSKTKGLRSKGYIPAIVYAQGKESESIKVSTSTLLKVIHQHRIENAVISLKVKDGKKQKSLACIIKEIQYDPVKGGIMHLDFNEISLTKTIKINVPVTAKGEPIGVKQEGGSLEHVLWELEIECLPADIPKEIEVDVSQLNIGDSIHVKDLTVPSNIRILNDPDSIVLSVVAPLKEEVVAVPLEGEEKQEPEVIKEKKEVPDEEKQEEKEKK
jgi:large subunit ribosomal protein L25